MALEQYGSLFDYGESPLYKDEGESVVAAPIEESIDTEGDIKLILDRGVLPTVDIQTAVRDLLRDPGMETAVMVSLFSDRRAAPDDQLPDNSGDRRGWWGDALNTAGDVDGSRLWLTFRSKITDKTAADIEEYTREALNWMLEDSIAEKITVSASRTAMNVITWTIEITRPKTGAVEYFKYYYNWQYQVYGRA